MYELQYGQVVKSKAGRDKDKIFVIINIEEEYAYLADGHLRRMEKPKQKKMKVRSDNCTIHIYLHLI